MRLSKHTLTYIHVINPKNILYRDRLSLSKQKREVRPTKTQKKKEKKTDWRSCYNLLSPFSIIEREKSTRIHCLQVKKVLIPISIDTQKTSTLNNPILSKGEKN